MSIARTTGSIIARWGEAVGIISAVDGAEKTVRGMVQPIVQKGTGQNRPTPLGIQDEGRYLYLGMPEHSLAAVEYVTWQGRAYDIETAHSIYVGATLSHWWAVLVPRYEEGP